MKGCNEKPLTLTAGQWIIFLLVNEGSVNLSRPALPVTRTTQLANNGTKSRRPSAGGQNHGVAGNLNQAVLDPPARKTERRAAGESAAQTVGRRARPTTTALRCLSRRGPGRDRQRPKEGPVLDRCSGRQGPAAEQGPGDGPGGPGGSGGVLADATHEV